MTTWKKRMLFKIRNLKREYEERKSKENQKRGNK